MSKGAQFDSMAAQVQHLTQELKTTAHVSRAGGGRGALWPAALVLSLHWPALASYSASCVSMHHSTALPAGDF